jgi:AcrR family transcriptional regulator
MPAKLDRRSEIISAGLNVLRMDGYAGFTQPRVARAVGVRQSLLTYYFPTRLDLLTAVATEAIQMQLAAVDTILSASSPGAVATAIARIALRYENTRVIMALAQSADREPALRRLFHTLAAGILSRAAQLLQNLGIEPTPENCYLVHAMSVGMAVITLATASKDAEKRSVGALELALKAMQRHTG